MSLINEALKQARSHTDNARRGEMPSARPPVRPPRRRPTGNSTTVIMISVAVGACVLVLAGIGAVYVHSHARQGPSETAAVPPPAAAQPVATAAAKAADEAGATAAAASPEILVQPPAAAAAKVMAAAEPVEAPVVAVPAPETAVAAPPEIREKYQVKGIMKTRTGFMALLNSAIVYEGDFLRDGAQVTEIGERHLQLRVGDRTYRLTFSRGADAPAAAPTMAE